MTIFVELVLQSSSVPYFVTVQVSEVTDQVDLPVKMAAPFDVTIFYKSKKKKKFYFFELKIEILFFV